MNQSEEIITLKNLQTAVLKFLEPLDTRETYSLIVHEARKLVKVEDGAIYLRNKNRSFDRVYATSRSVYAIEPRKRGYVYRAFSSRKPIIVDGEVLLRIHPETKQLKIAAVLYVPLSYRGKSIGVLAIGARKKRDFTKNELHILKIFGSVASMGIRKAQLNLENKQALEARDLFISIASHELKTPLTSMSGYTQLLHNRLSKQNTQEGKWVQLLYGETIRLTKLVNELLEINRIKTGQFQYVMKECHWSEILARILGGFEVVHPHHRLVFHNKLKTSDIVIGDFDKLIQVITNVLNNAAKFSPPEKEITLTLETQGPYFVITVKDQGRGIEKERLPVIFEGYAKRHDDTVAGLGLGLLLAKHIVTYHRGLIIIRSQVGRGTTVEIRLPKPSKQ